MAGNRPGGKDSMAAPQQPVRRGRGYFMERGRAFSPDGHRLSERISGEFYGKPGETPVSFFYFIFFEPVIFEHVFVLNR